MSSGTAPCCGHVLEATENNFLKFGLTKKDLIELANKDIEKPFTVDDDFSEILDHFFFENVNVPLNIPSGTIEAEIIRYSRSDGGDIYDDLEDGYYFIFGESDLYDVKLNKTGKAFKHIGLLPKFKQWTNFG